MENMADAIGLTSGINASNASNLINAKSLIALNATFTNTASTLTIGSFNSAIILVESFYATNTTGAYSRAGIGICIVPNMSETAIVNVASNNQWTSSNVYFSTTGNSISFYNKSSNSYTGYINGVIAILS